MSGVGRGERTPWLWVLVAGGVLTQTGLNLLRPVTSYKLLEFGAGSTAIGISTAAYAVIPLAVAVLMGRLSDRMRSLAPLLVAGALLLGFGGACLALAPGVVTVAAASTLLGFGHLVFTIAGQTSIARYSSTQRLDAGFGWFTAAYSVGQLLGPFLGGLLVEGPGITTGLWIGAAIGAAGAVLFVLPLPGAPRTRRADPVSDTTSADTDAPTAAAPGTSTASDPGRPSILRILRVAGIPTLMLSSLSLLSMLDILTAFLPVVGEQLGIGAGVVGVLLALRAAASIVCRAVLPTLVLHVGRRGLMLWCLFGAAVSLALPPLALGWWSGALGIAVAGVLLVVGGFFLGLGQPLTMSAITQSVPQSWRGSALAVRLMGNRLGQVIMPALAGLVALSGPAGAIWMTCVLLGVSGVAVLRRPAASPS